MAHLMERESVMNDIALSKSSRLGSSKLTIEDVSTEAISADKVTEKILSLGFTVDLDDL